MIKHKNDLNVFTYGYSPWRTPHNWFDNIKQFFRNIKYAWQRATRGFCNQDAWGLDDFYTQLIRDSLLYLADNHCGYPGTEEMNSDEKWTQFLRDTALLLDKSIDYSFNDEQYFINKYEKEYSDLLGRVDSITWEHLPDGCYKMIESDEISKIAKKYIKEEVKINKKRVECKDKALDNLKKYWYNFWD